MITPYEPLEVIECVDVSDRRAPHIYYVRDDAEAQWWARVEYLRRRLVCWCDEGRARVADEYVPECRHLAAVVRWRALSQGTSLQHAPINPSTFVD